MFFDFVRRSIRNKYFVLLIVFGLLPTIILGVISNYFSSKILENELNKSMYQAIEKASINIDSIIQRMSFLSDLISRNSDIIKSIDIDGVKETTELNKKEKRTINEALKSASASFNFPTHIFIVDRYLNLYSNIDIIQSEEKDIVDRINESSDFLIPLKYENRVHLLGMQENLLSGYDSEKIYYLAKNIIYDGKYFGTIYIGTGDYILSRMLNNIKISEESKIFVYDESENILFTIPDMYSNAYQSEGKTIKSILKERIKPQYIKVFGEYNSVSFFTSAFNWNIIMITPTKSIRGKLKNISNVTITITILSILFILLFLILVNRNFVKPIVYLSGLMKVARKGNLEVRSDLKNLDEIGVLSEGFNKLLTDFKKMIEKAQADEIQKKELEFKVFQSQIKPHFLYNTLNSIRWMAEMNNEKKVADSIVYLVRMLEYNTKSSDKLVSISDEIQYIEEYLKLQSLRYLNKFDSSLEVSGEVYDFKILKLTLQPIIENCIMHGLPGNKRKMLIKIIGRREDEKIIFNIEDNGIGIGTETLNQLEIKLRSNKYRNSSKGIGLANVNDRIKLEFGENFGLSIMSIIGEGTVVKMTIPVTK